MAADERAQLREWLALYREKIAEKCAGLTGEQLARMSVAPSRLSLLGLVRHLTEMERAFLRNGVGRAGLPLVYCSDEDPDADFEGVAGADPDAVFATWREECRLADEAIEAVSSLDEGEWSLRWCLVKVATEYARHTGHADLLRERIDGVVGD
jgi:Protein of unknown function (DUF664)